MYSHYIPVFTEPDPDPHWVKSWIRVHKKMWIFFNTFTYDDVKFCTYLRYDAIHSKRFYKENKLDVICNFTATYCAHSLNITRDTVPLIVMIH